MHKTDMKMTVTLDKKDVELAVKTHVAKLLGVPEESIVNIAINVGTKTISGNNNPFEDGVFKNIEVIVKGEIPSAKEKFREQVRELERKDLGYKGLDPN